jgi:DNA gyrase/topoisomerase IV subunit A
MDIAAIEVLDNMKLADESVVAYIIITTSGGKVIKMSMDDLPVVARPARGNIVVNLENGEIVTAVTVSYEKPE